MKLYIDTTNKDNTNIAIYKNNNNLIKKNFSDEDTTPESLLGLIHTELNALGKKLKDINEIEVERGPGSFTGVRVGIAVANALSLALNIPINDKDNGELEVPEY